MATTRIRNDPIRIQKEMDIFTYPGKYNIDVPGPGVQMDYIEDPHLRLQFWGANRYTNMIDIDANLKGYTKKLSRDYLNVDEYTNISVMTDKIKYQNYTREISDETRSTLPAFLFRDVELSRWEEPFINPQSYAEIPFQWNLQTRIIEKDSLYNKTPPINQFEPSYWFPSSSNT